VYDMYPWDSAAPEGHRPGTSRTPDATDAVQIALDRRDNGGDATAAPIPADTATAAPIPASTAPASPTPVSTPLAGPTRQ
jgi:hypothetical protein